MAVERIEAALARVNKASDRLGSTPRSGTAITAAHESLKEEIAGTIKDLDALIESIEQ